MVQKLTPDTPLQQLSRETPLTGGDNVDFTQSAKNGLFPTRPNWKASNLKGWQAVTGLGPPLSVPVPSPVVDDAPPDESTEIAQPLKQATQAQSPVNPGIRHVAVSTYGVGIPVSIGRRVITGNTIDATDLVPNLVGAGMTTSTNRTPIYDGGGGEVE